MSEPIELDHEAWIDKHGALLLKMWPGGYLKFDLETRRLISVESLNLPADELRNMERTPTGTRVKLAVIPYPEPEGGNDCE